MKITLLGTGANECIPAFRCKCPICTNARIEKGKEIRQNSCALIENTCGESLLIDMPPQIMSLLANSELDSTYINNILFTHRHEDHILGARYLFQGCSRKGFEIELKAQVFMPETVYTSMSGKFLYNKPSSELEINTENYKINFVKALKTYSIAGMKVTPVKTNHLDESFGYIIEDVTGKTIVYLLDAAKVLPEKTLEILSMKQIDVLIVDCTFKETNRDSGHSDIEGAIELKKTVKPIKMILSHIGHRNLSQRELVSTMSFHHIEIGYDGMTITV